jgi:chromosome segregation ATPase
MRLKEDLLLRDRMVVERTAERDALARLLAEVEREAAARGERARTLRIQLAEREREVEVLRIEIMDRDRRLAALEQVLPPGAEQQRLQDELRVARKRMDELLEETARRDQLGDDAVSTALRERARAVRLNEALEQAVRERDELRGQLADLDQRMSELLSETEHLRGELFRRQGQALDE